MYLTGFDEGNAFLLLETDERRQLAHSTLLVQPKVRVLALANFAHFIPFLLRFFLFLCNSKQREQKTEPKHKNKTKPHLQTETLFSAPRYTTTTQDPSREMWDGYRAGPDAAQAQTGVDAAYDLSHIETALSARRTGAVRYGPVLTTSTLHRLSATSNAHARTVAAVQRTAASAQGHDARRPLPLEPHLQRLRLRKSVGELEVLRCAAAVSTAAMTAAMRSTQAETNERQLDALIEYEMRLRGASALAYPPVVAGGARANTLHYVRNDQELCDGEMVLVDAGAEYGGYCADITRVWPVGGRFSAPQAALYNAVLAVQRQCLAALAAEEVRTLQALGSLAQHVLLDELLQLGLVRASATVDAQRTALQQLMPHSIGHYLGMDVHDCGTVSTLAELGAGVVLTIEPGVYVPDVPSVPAEFRGMGIRIEDDVVMSYGGGVENLTHACAKVRVGQREVKDWVVFFHLK